MRQIYSIKKNILLLAIIFESFVSKAQFNYSVVPIPFVQYTGSLPVSFSSDDRYSATISLPFSFNFYGNTYNNIVVGTNGNISFNTALANGSCPWSFSTTIPNASFPVKNSILGCYHDTDNSNAQGTTTYGTYGSAPNRKFVVIFSNQSHYSATCTAIKSSFQMILSETTNNIDIQLIDKGVCNTWNGGRAVTGLIDASGSQAITPTSRNTGSWTASHEGWRFYRPGYNTNYSYVKCDSNTDGFETFDLQVAFNDLSLSMGNAISFYATLADAQSQSAVNMLPFSYSNITPFNETIYAVGGGQIKPIYLSTFDCSVDADNDTVATNLEDINNDTNLANDDTDFDGIANYLDNDDDGDLILTNLEYVFLRSTTNVLALRDTDNDGKPNYIDNDDDGDGVLTFKEDYNGDGNPANDDTNSNGTPDYLESAVALGTQQNEFKSNISLYPNPTSNILNIENLSTETISNIEIYSTNGSLIKQIKPTESIESIDVSNLQTGVYFVKIIISKTTLNYKFIKK